MTRPRRLSRIERERLAAALQPAPPAPPPRDPNWIPPAPDVPPSIFAELPGHDQRQALRARAIDQLFDAAAGAKPAVRARCLSVALTGIRDWESAESREIESAIDRWQARELKRIADNQRRIQGGVVRESDAPVLPGEDD